MAPVESLGRRRRTLRGVLVAATLSAWLAVACSGTSTHDAPAGRTSQEVIYGASSSLEWQERSVDSPLFERTLAVVPVQGEAVLQPGAAPLLGELLPELCASELWLDQPAWSNCSGIFLGGRWALTARHCVESPAFCQENVLVRRYRLGPAGVEPIADEDVFHCERVVFSSDESVDMAILELSRDSSELAPLLPVSSWRLDARIFLAHHPLGTPLKVDEQARLIGLEPPAVWTDAFAGSSGSPISDASGRLLGLISGGARDFERAPEGCLRARRLERVDEAGGEHLLPALPVLCEVCDVEPDPLVCASLPSEACAPPNRLLGSSEGPSCGLRGVGVPGQAVVLVLLAVGAARRRIRTSRRWLGVRLPGCVRCYSRAWWR